MRPPDDVPLQRAVSSIFRLLVPLPRFERPAGGNQSSQWAAPYAPEVEGGDHEADLQQRAGDHVDYRVIVAATKRRVGMGD